MIVVGRSESKTEKHGKLYAGFVGKVFKKNRDQVELKENVFLDLNEPHMMVICGKRGYGKSYTLSIIAEELMNLDQKVRENLSIIIIDAMGIYWSLQERNKEQEKLLHEWGLTPKKFPITVYYPYGLKDKYSKYQEFFHKGFKLYPSELTLSDWLFLLDIKETQAQTGLLSKLIKKVRAEHSKFYSITDMLLALENTEEAENIKSALERKLEKADTWGIFSDRGEEIEEIFKGGEAIVLDLSGAGELPWNVRTTLTAIIARKMYSKRALARNIEEIQRRYNEKFTTSTPLVWLFIDEAHIFAPSTEKTAATAPLLEWVRQGRRPGLSLVLATQQPGALDSRILSQCDTLIIHRLTAGQDSKVIGARISEIHGSKSIMHYMKVLPKEPGFAIIMNDQTEDIVPIKIRPRQSLDSSGSAKLEEYIKP